MQGTKNMTQLLENAVQAVYQLPDEQQNAIATLILEELADEQRWQNAFEASQNQLSRLAQKVRQDIQAGKIKEQGFDEL
jgi:aspartate/tyrosine/aromatic aminotransferase